MWKRAANLLRQIEFFAQRMNVRHAPRPGKLRRRRGRSIAIRKSGTMTFRWLHRIERTPIGPGRLIRVKRELRGISSFHSAPLLWRR